MTTVLKKTFSPDIDLPYMPSPRLEVIFGPGPITPRQIMIKLHDDPTPELYSILGLKKGIKTVKSDELMTTLCEDLRPLFPAVSSCADLDLLERPDGYAEAIRRFESGSVGFEAKTYLRQMGLLRVAWDLAESAKDRIDLFTRLVELLLRGPFAEKQLCILDHKVRDLIRLLSFVWILKMKPGEEAADLWQTRMHHWEEIYEAERMRAA